MQDEAVEIVKRLDALARRVLLSKPHARDLTSSVPQMESHLQAAFDDGKTSPEARGDELLRHLGEHVDDAILARAAFRPGSVYSFFDDSAEADECRPSDSRLVFAGYTETGHPRWTTLLELLLEAKDERAGDVAKESSQPITLTMSRREIVGGMLDSFAEKRRAYDICGQLILGYFRQSLMTGREKFAVTLQLVRSASRSRVVRLGINVIGVLPDGRDAMEAEAEQERWPFVQLLAEARRRLAAINPKLKKLPRGERMRAAADAATHLLHEMSLGFARGTRRDSWRTEHATKRAEEGARPTGMARQDFASSRNDRVFMDVQESTFIIVGPKGRTHVFAPTGKHVTSLQLDGAAVADRIRRNRWRPAPLEELKNFRRLVRHAFRSGVAREG